VWLITTDPHKGGSISLMPPEELKQRTIERVRRFLQAHVPMHAAAH
jgi:hypothetical protein